MQLKFPYYAGDYDQDHNGDEDGDDRRVPLAFGLHDRIIGILVGADEMLRGLLFGRFRSLAGFRFVLGRVALFLRVGRLPFLGRSISGRLIGSSFARFAFFSTLVPVFVFPLVRRPAARSLVVYLRRRLSVTLVFAFIVAFAVASSPFLGVETSSGTKSLGLDGHATPIVEFFVLGYLRVSFLDDRLQE